MLSLNSDPFSNDRLAMATVLVPVLFCTATPFGFEITRAHSNWRTETGQSSQGIGTSDSARVWIEPITKMEFLHVKAGKFMMGVPPGEAGQLRLAHYHEVELTRDFYLGKYEVTQAQWRQIMGNNPSQFQDCGADCPVEMVNWFEVQQYIERLNELSGGERLRLPTEAEWEYACRAGTTTPFSTGGNLTTEQGNYDGNYPYDNYPKGKYMGATTRVGSYPANPWGFHDMHGNVWEWCLDFYCEYPTEPVFDPLGDCDSDKRIIRGGSWYFNAESARSGRRYIHSPSDRGFSLGFRLVREATDLPASHGMN